MSKVFHHTTIYPRLCQNQSSHPLHILRIFAQPMTFITSAGPVAAAAPGPASPGSLETRQRLVQVFSRRLRWMWAQFVTRPVRRLLAVTGRGRGLTRQPGGRFEAILFRSQVELWAAGLRPTDSVFAFEKTPSPPHRLKERTLSSNCFGSIELTCIIGLVVFMAIRLSRISLSRFEPALFKSFSRFKVFRES